MLVLITYSGGAPFYNALATGIGHLDQEMYWTNSTKLLGRTLGVETPAIRVSPFTGNRRPSWGWYRSPYIHQYLN